MNSKKQILLLLLFAAPLFWVALNAQENRTLPIGSFKMQGVVGDLNKVLQEQYQNIKPIIVTDLPAEQVKKECTFFGGDSLIGFDFTKASKLALLEGDKIYMEFQSFIFKSQAEFVKNKYHIKALPFEIEEARKIITPPSILSGPCNNIDFENGNFSGWVTSRGVNNNSTKPLTIYQSPAKTSTNQGIHTCNDLNIITSIYGNDPMCGVAVPGLDPLGGNYSVRVGGPDLNTADGYGYNCGNSKYYYSNPSNGEELSQTFVVTAANDLISYDYAVILNDGGHSAKAQPYFHASITDQAGTILDSCTDYYVEAISGNFPPGFTPIPGQPTIQYLPWKSNSINLSSYIGQTVVLSFTAAGCTQGAHFAYAYVDASCGPAQINAHTVCGGSTATLTAPASYGGTYSWSGPTIIGISTGQSVVVGSAGTYSVTVVPPQGPKCKYVLTIAVSFSAMTSSISSISNVACKGIHSGSASVSPVGGIPAFTYSWSNGQITSAATGLGAGTYTVIVSDAEGCTHSNTVAITQPTSVLKDTISSFTQSTCTLSTGSATDSASGGTPGYTYLWIPGGQTTTTATGLSPGTYSVHVTDANGCPSTSSVTITIPAANGPTVTPTVSNNVLCQGGSDGSAIATVNGGQSPFTYLWIPSGQTTSAVTGLTSGTYSIDVTDANGCSFVSTLSVSQPSALTTAIAHTNISCNGFTNGIATANPAGGTQPYTYSWNSSPGQTTQTASNLGVGAYTVSVTDANGCAAPTQSITISEPQAITAGITSTATQCYGDSTGTATVGAPSGGSSPYTYSWNSNPVQSGNQALGLPAGIYSVLITDAHGCPSTQSVAVTQPSQITYSITSSGYGCVSVGQGVISISQPGGGAGLPYNYSWSNGGSTLTISNLLNGYYIVTVTDPHGCIVQKGATIPAAPLPIITPIPSGVSCYGLSDGGVFAQTSSGTGPLTYLWLPSGQTTPAMTGLSAGTYTISVVDSLGCNATNTVSVTQPAVLTTAITSFDPCILTQNGSATATPTGGTQPYTYLWGTSPPQNTLTANNLGAGTYSVAVTDAHGCTSTQTITLTEPADILAPISHSTLLCHGDDNGSAIVGTTTGGYGQYTYTWITNPVQNGPTASGLSAGTYSVLVTDAHGCTPTQPFTITIDDPTAVTYTATMSGSSCGPHGLGVASVSGVVGGTGPYSYLWSNGNTTTSISYLSSGTYVVTVMDAHGCPMPTSLTLTASVQPQADFTFTESLSCEGITVQFTNLSQQETGHTWYFDVNSSSTEQDPAHTYTSSGTYWAILAVANPPCVDTMAKVITVGNFIPQNMGATNIFTPNGDGKNDCFTLVPGDTSATTAYAVRNCLSVEIFDRWGVKMYESVGADNCWDGKNKKDNKPAAEGTYFYVAKVGKTVIKGYVTLMR